MPYDSPGLRHTVRAAPRACVHGQIVTAEGFVGRAAKVSQPDRFALPATMANIAIGEEFELMLEGIAEAPAAGAVAAAAIGAHVYIDTTDDSLELAAGGLTGAALNAGMLPVGIVTEIDTIRTPDVLRVNLSMAHLVRGNSV